MAAKAAIGRVKMQLMNSDNESFNEFPFYINKNVLSDEFSTTDAQNIIDGLDSIVDNLTTNTSIKHQIEYTVDLVSLAR